MVSGSRGRQGPRFSIRMVIWIFCSDTVFVQLNQFSQILSRQCCLSRGGVSRCRSCVGCCWVGGISRCWRMVGWGRRWCGVGVIGWGVVWGWSCSHSGNYAKKDLEQKFSPCFANVTHLHAHCDGSSSTVEASNSLLIIDNQTGSSSNGASLLRP